MNDVITPEVTQEQVTQESVPETKTETISDIIDKPAQVEKQTVGLDKYMQEKKDRQAAEKKLAELESTIKSGATKSEISEDIESIANEYNIDSDFLARFAKGIESKFEGKIKETLRPITEEKEKARFEATFTEKLNEAMQNMPEYAKVINPTVIKQLFLLRDDNGKLVNGNISLEQLIENTYVNAIGGKRTMESGRPTGKQEPGEVDFNKAASNTEYFNEIMANPTLKAKYNANIEKRLNL